MAQRIPTSSAWIQVENLGNLNGDINGFFTLNEQSGGMRVGTIKSSDDDVTLNAPGAIYDAPVGSSNPPATGDSRKLLARLELVPT